MSNLKHNYKSFYDFYNTILHGNEIEFVFKHKRFFVLPLYNESEIIGVVFGESNSNEEIICLSEDELFSVPIENEILGNVFNSIEIVWSNI